MGLFNALTEIVSAPIRVAEAVKKAADKLDD